MREVNSGAGGAAGLGQLKEIRSPGLLVGANARPEEKGLAAGAGAAQVSRANSERRGEL